MFFQFIIFNFQSSIIFFIINIFFVFNRRNYISFFSFAMGLTMLIFSEFLLLSTVFLRFDNCGLVPLNCTIELKTFFGLFCILLVLLPLSPFKTFLLYIILFFFSLLSYHNINSYYSLHFLNNLYYSYKLLFFQIFANFLKNCYYF